MDTLVRLTLTPLGVWTTPWQADTLLGAMANVWARWRGVEDLRQDFLDPWLARRPLFIISDAFPGNELPTPAHLPLPMWEWPPEDRKQVKKIRLLSPDDFRSLQRGSRPRLDHPPKSSIRNHVRMRNSVARSTDSTAEDGGLFTVPYSELNDPDGSLSIYARASSEGLDILVEALRMLGQTGYGARASVGHGGFELVGDAIPVPNLDDVPGANGFVSLSTFQPASSDPTDGYWRSFVKYGKLAPEFHHRAIFKRPQVMLQPGACFRTNEPPKLFYGGPILPERLFGDSERSVLAAHNVHPVQAAFGLAVPMIWKEAIL